jgi:hypothetical protein
MRLTLKAAEKSLDEIKGLRSTSEAQIAAGGFSLIYDFKQGSMK